MKALISGTTKALPNHSLQAITPAGRHNPVKTIDQRFSKSTATAVSKALKQKVLVVDDEPDTVELIAFNLRNAGYSVVTAENGAEALRKARATPPDLVILDLMLPEVDGLEVCKILRADPLTSKVPVLMLTAKAAEVDRVLGLELGAKDYMTKPFSPRELVLRVRNLLTQDAGEQEQIFQFGDLHIDI